MNLFGSGATNSRHGRFPSPDPFTSKRPTARLVATDSHLFPARAYVRPLASALFVPADWILPKTALWAGFDIILMVAGIAVQI